MSDEIFTEVEQQFFAEGEALAQADTEPATEDFSDLDDHASDDRTGSWVKRALEVLSLIRR